MESILNFVNDLGNFVFIPLIFLIIMLILRESLANSIRSAMKVGIGFLALGMVVDFMLSKLQPVIEQLAEKTGSTLSTIDVGGASTAVMGLASNLGALVIVLCFGVNILMLLTGFTDCVNVDVYNLHQNASMGIIVAIYSGNFMYGFCTAALLHVWALIMADYTAKKNQDFFGLPESVSISHPIANSYVPFAVMFNWIFDRIPVINRINITSETIEKRMGIFGENTMIGFIVGFLLSIFSVGLSDPYHAIIASIQLGMQMGAVLLLLPKMAGIMMEGLLPMSEAAKRMLVNKFPNRKITVGLDTAIIVGDPSVIAPSLILIPSLLIMAVILPGNTVLPLGDLPYLCFYIACMVPIFKGNIFRIWLSSLICFGGGLYLATWLSAPTTQAFLQFGTGGQAGLSYSSIDPSANPFTALFALATNYGYIAFAAILIIMLAYAYQQKNRRLNKTLVTVEEGE